MNNKNKYDGYYKSNEGAIMQVKNCQYMWINVDINVNPFAYGYFNSEALIRKIENGTLTKLSKEEAFLEMI